MSGVSAENAGIYNYTRKSEFRRYLDREIRSEGYDLFNPNPWNLDVPMPPTDGEPITLCVECIAENGRRAVVVGTKTKLWRYAGVENGAYFEDGYVEPGYTDDNPGAWIEIGGGFSRMGRRWEAVVVAGWLFLNNGVDLPVSYRVDEMAVEPVWELREQGIASVGTIWKFNDILKCGDIRQLNSDKHKEIMSSIPAAVDAGQDGASFVRNADDEAVLGTVSDGAGGVGTRLSCTTEPVLGLLAGPAIGAIVRLANGIERVINNQVNASEFTLDGEPILAEPLQPFAILPAGVRFDLITPPAATLFPDVADPASLVGLRLFWDSGDTRKIIGYDGDSGCFIVDSEQSIPSGPVSLENSKAYAAFTEEAYVDRFKSRTLWSMPGQPRRFASIIPGTVNAGSSIVELTYPVRSLESGQDITITDAGENGEALRTTVLWAYPGIARSLVIADEALPGVTESINAARATEAAAQLTVESTNGTLLVQQAALTAAKAASEAEPDDAEKTQAVADASAKVDTARATAVAAQASLVAATTAKEKAEKIETTAEVLLTRSDAAGSIVGFDDLIGDGSGILRGIELRGFSIVAKETGFFIGRYTGKAGSAFAFEEINIPKGSALRYRGTLIQVSDDYLVYAGDNSFYRFDLATRTPQELDVFKTCLDTFFDNLDHEQGLGPPLPIIADDDQHATWENLDGDKLYELDTGLRQVGSYRIQPTSDSESYEGRKAIFAANCDPAMATLREVLSADVDDLIFATSNSLTNEIWFCFPSQQDNVLRLDLEFLTMSTSNLPISSAVAVRRPESKIDVGKAVHWFIMGGTNGTVLRYGLTNEPVRPSGEVKGAGSGDTITSTAAFFKPDMVGKTLLFANKKCVSVKEYVDSRHVKVWGSTAGIQNQTFIAIPAIWHRNGQAYNSVLESGLDSFGKPGSEKQWTQYVPTLASQQSGNIPVKLDFRRALNPSEGEDAFSTTLAKPLTNNLVTLILVSHYLGDRVTVSGINNPCELSGRTLWISGVDSRSFNQRG